MSNIISSIRYKIEHYLDLCERYDLTPEMTTDAYGNETENISGLHYLWLKERARADDLREQLTAANKRIEELEKELHTTFIAQDDYCAEKVLSVLRSHADTMGVRLDTYDGTQPCRINWIQCVRRLIDRCAEQEDENE